MIIYSFFVIAGQSFGTLLGRLYFDNGVDSEWLATLVQVAGFPVLFPFQYFAAAAAADEPTATRKNPNSGVILPLHRNLSGGRLHALFNRNPVPPCHHLHPHLRKPIGIQCSVFLLNKQKFTPYIINSLVLLTISSVLLVFQPDQGDSNKASKSKYIVGFICTLAASAGYAIMLSLTQLAFQKIIKKETIRAVVDMTIYQNVVATAAILVGLFGSGDWNKLSGEMQGYKTGRVSYVMNLFWTAVSWQVFGVGCIGLIFKISSLFSNVISVVGLPVAPVLAVIFLEDRLTGLKAVAMVLAMWGFVSYIYQHYLDDLKKKEKQRTSADDHQLVDERGGSSVTL